MSTRGMAWDWKYNQECFSLNRLECFGAFIIHKGPVQYIYLTNTAFRKWPGAGRQRDTDSRQRGFQMRETPDGHVGPSAFLWAAMWLWGYTHIKVTPLIPTGTLVQTKSA